MPSAVLDIAVGFMVLSVGLITASVEFRRLLVRRLCCFMVRGLRISYSRRESLSRKFEEHRI